MYPQKVPNLQCYLQVLEILRSGSFMEGLKSLSSFSSGWERLWDTSLFLFLSFTSIPEISRHSLLLTPTVVCCANIVLPQWVGYVIVK